MVTFLDKHQGLFEHFEDDGKSAGLQDSFIFMFVTKK